MLFLILMLFLSRKYEKTWSKIKQSKSKENKKDKKLKKNQNKEEIKCLRRHADVLTISCTRQMALYFLLCHT